MFQPLSIFIFIMILSFHPIQTKKDFIFHFDNRDPLVQRQESKSKIDFIVNRYKEDPGPEAFIYEKKKTNPPDTLNSLIGLDLKYRDNIINLLKDYNVILKEQVKTGHLTLFEKWMEGQYKSFYVVEKKGDIYLKYQVTLYEISVDYQLRICSL